MLKIEETNAVHEFSPELYQQFQSLIQRYPAEQPKAALLPILHVVQAEFGWLSASAMDKVADFLDIQPIEVYEVASFYTMYFFASTREIHVRGLPNWSLLLSWRRKNHEIHRTKIRCKRRRRNTRRLV